MKHPHGYCLDRRSLARAPSLQEAVALMPHIPPVGIQGDLLVRWHRAMRSWSSEVLWPAVQRESENLNVRFLDLLRQAGRPARRAAPLPPPSRRLPQARTADAGRPGTGLLPGLDPATLPLHLTDAELATLARVSLRAVQTYVQRTRQGLVRPGSAQYLPRAPRIAAGIARADALAWLAARGQLRGPSAGRGPSPRPAPRHLREASA